ncbi:MAG: hypothetical protein APR53_03575 [Methanoculleus sp. SDB]|nr:MAG: hypothetical protein APR53_03575 [Methanoculleus sp. SDB]
MYGRYEYDYHYSDERIHAGIVRNRGYHTYTRKISGMDTVEKRILSDEGRIIVNPVEPLNLPSEITNLLEIEFDSLLIEPFGKKEIYLTFPIEIGVFIAAKKNIQVLDIFSFSPPKYSLYGPSNGGDITRWWHSDVFDSIPDVNRDLQGVMQLTIDNTHREWIEVSRAVFEGYGMKIYFGDIVSMVARLKIINRRLAETEFYDTPLTDVQSKALELYTARELHVVKRTYEMDWGVM